MLCSTALRLCIKTALILLILIFVKLVLFEVTCDHSLEALRKQQYVHFQKPHRSYLGHLINHIAAYLHSRTPLLDIVPYANPLTDTRRSTWHLPPHQVVIEWFFYVPLFVVSLVWLRRPTALHAERRRINKPWNCVLFNICLWTLLIVVYYKIRAWVELGEWFALLYLLQPCHMVVLGYVILCVSLMRDSTPSGAPSSRSVDIMNTLWDLQWTTIVALALPDTTALVQRGFWGEYTMFYFEHVLLIVLPLLASAVFFPHTVNASRREKLIRVWRSFCVFGIHNIEVMTPVSLVSGIQINYQTHLPQYAMRWTYGRWYKLVIAIGSLIACAVFAFGLEPIWKRIVARMYTTRHSKKKLI